MYNLLVNQMYNLLVNQMYNLLVNQKLAVSLCYLYMWPDNFQPYNYVPVEY